MFDMEEFLKIIAACYGDDISCYHHDDIWAKLSTDGKEEFTDEEIRAAYLDMINNGRIQDPHSELGKLLCDNIIHVLDANWSEEYIKGFYEFCSLDVEEWIKKWHTTDFEDYQKLEESTKVNMTLIDYHDAKISDYVCSAIQSNLPELSKQYGIDFCNAVAERAANIF